MYKYITKKLLLSLSMGIFIGLGIAITYAANITSISGTYNSGDTLGVEWFNHIKARLSNIYGSGANVGIGTSSPTTKLDVSGTVKATSFQGDGSALTGISGIPSGFIGSFYLSNCPSGWTLANGANGTPDLRGAFIRGMGGDANGRDVARTLGSYQADDFTSHTHQHKWNAGGVGSCSEIQMTATCQGYTDTLATGGTETRPKNVSLIYCMKQ